MDIYIQPSKQEGLPRALIEAMSRALPAIGTNIAGIPELLDHNYLINKGSYKEIVNALSEKFDKTQMIEQATKNFNKASEYSLKIINARRQAFFDVFINDVRKNNR
ncbi:MAG: glycosyltransferase, partial [Erysipelotrichaceae bacterium]|nr:glycosyltransferase [Erysipelotrichaceae bacterium]